MIPKTSALFWKRLCQKVCRPKHSLINSLISMSRSKVLNLFFSLWKREQIFNSWKSLEKPIKMGLVFLSSSLHLLCMAFCMPQLNSLFCRNNIVTPSREQQFPWAGLKMFCFFRANKGRENCGRWLITSILW